ncbi:MAG: hypothetical protein R3B51_04800 [Thermodesulfobacteriota bacterium]
MVSRAGASIVLEMAEGMTIPEIEAMSAGLLGIRSAKRLTLTRHGCVHLGFNTLKAAVESWRRRLLEKAALPE